MSAVMPQEVVDRIFAFMAMEKTGRIELNFKRGQLLGLDIVESIRVGSDDRTARWPDSLDDPQKVPQDSIT